MPIGTIPAIAKTSKVNPGKEDFCFWVLSKIEVASTVFSPDGSP
jgi:hypothetical protein